MKRISFLLVTFVLCSTPSLRAQDAATEERLNKLSGQIEGFLESQQVLNKRLDGLAKEIENLREQINKPTGNYASQEDLKRLADAVKEIDRKRLEDYDKIRTELQKLGKVISTPPPSRTRTPPPTAADTSDNASKPSGPESGFEYIVKKGDTLSVIAQACREKSVKVTSDQILKANPGLRPEKLQVGQKLFIPAPQP